MDRVTGRGSLADEFLIITLQFVRGAQDRRIHGGYIYLGNFLGREITRIPHRETHVKTITLRS